jgi:putative ABC transport system substrate-binding protein
MRRRDFMKAVAAGAALSPRLAFAQKTDRVRRIAILLAAAPEDSEFQTWLGAFMQTLALSGWTIGNNLRVETRWARENAAEINKQAAELVALAPDVIVAHGASAVGPLLRVTRSVPVVFPIAGDPVGAGFVESLAKPGGNATGFMSTEFSMGSKRLELLKEIAPRVTRAGVLRDTSQGSGTSQFAAIQAVAPSLKIEVVPINMREAGEIERGVAAFARSADGGLIVTASPVANRHRDLIIALAARHKLPAVYYERFFVIAGGLISYGIDFVDHYRQAAGYVDRILKGEKPADLPVQAPTAFKLAINQKTATALGLELPTAVLARADEVIE